MNVILEKIIDIIERSAVPAAEIPRCACSPMHRKDVAVADNQIFRRRQLDRALSESAACFESILGIRCERFDNDILREAADLRLADDDCIEIFALLSSASFGIWEKTYHVRTPIAHAKTAAMTMILARIRQV